MQPKTILITGASSGLGTALALEYAASGVVLGLLGRNATRLEQVATDCRSKGAVVVTGLADVTHADAMTQWLQDFDRQYPVDLIIANAGISAGTGGGEESLQQATRLFEVNVTGVLNTALPLLEAMKARGRGQIALVSSLAGFRGLPTAPAYTASKGTVRLYGQALRGHLQPFGVDVRVVCPGFIKTPMTEINPFPMPFLMTAEKAAANIKRALHGRCGLIVFPWILYVAIRLQGLLPDDLLNWFYRRIPGKPAN